MAEEYRAYRDLGIRGFLEALGFAGPWKARKKETEWGGPCPIHKPKKNTSSFSFEVGGRYQCFSCSAKGRGAIDLVLAIEGINFRRAVEGLRGLDVRDDAEERLSGEQLVTKCETDVVVAHLVRRRDGELVAFLARTKEPAEGESKYSAMSWTVRATSRVRCRC